MSSKYEVILKAVESGSLTKAAKAYGYTQSGMSHILNAVETEFGFPIVTRTSSGITFNHMGENLKPYLQAVCDSERNLRKQVEQLRCSQEGTVRIGAFISASIHILPNFIAYLSEEKPELEVVLKIGNYEEIERSLLQGEIDLAFLLSPTREPLNVNHIMKDEIMVVLPKGHPLESMDYVPISKLAEFPYILYTNGHMEDFHYVNGFEKLSQGARYGTKDDAAILAMVENGLGVSLMPKLMTKHLSYNVSYRHIKPIFYRNIVLASMPGVPMTPAVRCFYDLFLDYQIPLYR